MIKPYKSLWSHILGDWPREYAKWLATPNTSSNDFFEKFMVSLFVGILAILLLVATIATKAAFLLLVAFVISAFDGIRFYGHYLRVTEDSADG